MTADMTGLQLMCANMVPGYLARPDLTNWQIHYLEDTFYNVMDVINKLKLSGSRFDHFH